MKTRNTLIITAMLVGLAAWAIYCFSTQNRWVCIQYHHPLLVDTRTGDAFVLKDGVKYEYTEVRLTPVDYDPFAEEDSGGATSTN